MKMCFYRVRLDFYGYLDMLKRVSSELSINSKLISPDTF